MGCTRPLSFHSVPGRRSFTKCRNAPVSITGGASSRRSNTTTKTPVGTLVYISCNKSRRQSRPLDSTTSYPTPSGSSTPSNPVECVDHMPKPQPHDYARVRPFVHRHPRRRAPPEPPPEPPTELPPEPSPDHPLLEPHSTARSFPKLDPSATCTQKPHHHPGETRAHTPRHDATICAISAPPVVNNEEVHMVQHATCFVSRGRRRSASFVGKFHVGRPLWTGSVRLASTRLDVGGSTAICGMGRSRFDSHVGTRGALF